MTYESASSSICLLSFLRLRSISQYILFSCVLALEGQYACVSFPPDFASFILPQGNDKTRRKMCALIRRQVQKRIKNGSLLAMNNAKF